MKDLQPLLAAAPSYVRSCRLLGTDKASFTLDLELPGRAPIPVHLTLSLEVGQIKVAPDPNVPAALKLPACCPERHINSDSSFCLGYDRSLTKALGDAGGWWQWLCRFLQLQLQANRGRPWPEHLQLDHGKAGSIVLDIRQRLDELPPTARMRLGKDGGKLDGMQLRLHPGTNSTDARLTNGRAKCVCGLGRLRRDCPGCRVVASIVALRVKRQIALKKFWADLRTAGHQCCRSMRECGLRRD